MVVILYKIQSFIALCTLVFIWQTSPSLSYGKEMISRDFVKLRILETTDLHASLINYNYYQGKEDNKIGLIHTASLIKQARAEVHNSLLFDVGDHLQGNPLGGYVAWIKGLENEEIHPVYRAFNYLRYDAITIGNHEFNYGLEFLSKALKGAKMPVVNANVLSASDSKPYFQPFVILKRKVMDESGQKQTLRIGVIGVMPPQIMHWDKHKLEGRVKAISMVTAVEKYIPKMKKEGADIIIVLAHTGISNEPYEPGTENAAYYIAKVPEVDAVLAGHSHAVFPGPIFHNLPQVNLETGSIFGKPVVMAGAYGSRLGIIDLNLKKMAGKWTVLSSFSSTRPIADESGASLVKTDQELYKLLKAEHLGTMEYMNKLRLSLSFTK